MSNDVLLVFLNSDEFLTKYSNALGEEKAHEINEKLHSHTRSTIEDLSFQKIIFHDGSSGNGWEEEFFRLEIPEGKSLNNKIRNAFENYIIQNKMDVNKVIFISADCPQLTKSIIENAFESLNKYDVCVGPEQKGGYYLIGMKEPLNFLFEDQLWNSNQLLDETLEALIEHGKNYFLLPELRSVNDIYDLHLLK